MKSTYNIGSVDLESVLKVRRRTLASIDEINIPYQHSQCKDTIYISRESTTHSLYSIESSVRIYGELQFICRLFERYTSNVFVHENVPGSNVNDSDTVANSVAKENKDKNDKNVASNDMNDVQETLDNVVSLLSSSKLSITANPESTNSSKQGSRRSSIVTSEYTKPNLEGRHYGFIQILDMNFIEILEVLLRAGLELVNESNVYDPSNVFHQHFIFSRPHHEIRKHVPFYF